MKNLFERFTSKGIPSAVVRSFQRFLIKHNAYENFAKEISHFDLTTRSDGLKNLIGLQEPGWMFSSTNYSEMINYTMFWDFSIQGYKYWSNLHTLWQDEAREISKRGRYERR